MRRRVGFPSWTRSSLRIRTVALACETFTKTGFVLVAGEVTADCHIEIPSIVRQTIKEIGYCSSEMGFDWQTCGRDDCAGAAVP